MGGGGFPGGKSTCGDVLGKPEPSLLGTHCYPSGKKSETDLLNFNLVVIFVFGGLRAGGRGGDTRRCESVSVDCGGWNSRALL